jgi:hypothetical protein
MCELIYLASPYSHDDPAVRKSRYEAACKATAYLIKQGHNVYSPIVYSHQLTEYGLGTEWETWSELDKAILRNATHLWVLQLEGWESSHGIQAELQLASLFGVPVCFVQFQDGVVRFAPEEEDEIYDRKT